ncbi:MAG: hypothetical protein LH474_04845 [Chamaesiphon sp.]|nr:hypothetical protein [Chamaesiphon sp.]
MNVDFIDCLVESKMVLVGNAHPTLLLSHPEKQRKSILVEVPAMNELDLEVWLQSLQVWLIHSALNNRL